MPSRMKWRGRTRKWILKRAYARELPAEILRRGKRYKSGARQIIGRQLGTLHSFGLKIKRRQNQKDDRTQEPASNKSECGSKQSIKPLDLGKLDELLCHRDNEGTG